MQASARVIVLVDYEIMAGGGGRAACVEVGEGGEGEAGLSLEVCVVLAWCLRWWTSECLE